MDADQGFQRLAQAGKLLFFLRAHEGQGPAEVGVCLHDVQVCVHGLVAVHVLVAEPGLLRGGPVLRQGLPVAAVLRVAGLVLQQREETDGLRHDSAGTAFIPQGLPDRGGVLGQGVEGERVPVDLLPADQGAAVGPYRPE